MKRSTMISTGVLFTLLVMVNIFVTWKIRSSSLDLSALQSDINLLDSEIKQAFWHNFTQGVSADGLKLDSVYIQWQKDAVPKLLSDYVRAKKQILVVRISEQHCESCVISFIEKLNRLSDELHLTDHILIMGTYFRRLSLQNIREQTSKFTMCNVHPQQMPSVLEETGFPYCFLLDEDMTIIHSFSPNKYVHELSNTYLNMISQRYFSDEK